MSENELIEVSAFVSTFPSKEKTSEPQLLTNLLFYWRVAHTGGVPTKADKINSIIIQRVNNK